jgi:hypothetical protein
MAAIFGLVKAAGPTINGIVAISKVDRKSNCHMKVVSISLIWLAGRALVESLGANF